MTIDELLGPDAVVVVYARAASTRYGASSSPDGSGTGNGYGGVSPCSGRTIMSAAKAHTATHGKSSGERTPARGIPIAKLGWTREMALEARRRVASLLDDWEDPSMDVYDEEP
jgi:hypothetical protein